MKMSYTPRILLCAVMYFITHLTSGDKAPNIVLMIADDLGMGDIGCFGNTSLNTPNIDRIAADGTKLTHHLAAAAVCTPSRAAFLTGRYPIRSGMAPHGTLQVAVFLSAINGLPREEVTFAKLVKTSPHNYTTGLVGKWHQGLHGSYKKDFEHHPLQHGFDYFYGFLATIIKDYDDSYQLAVRSRFPDIDLMFAAGILGGIVFIMFLRRRLLIGCCMFSTLVILLVVLPVAVWWAVLNLKILTGVMMRNYDIIEQPIDLPTLTDRLVNEGKDFISRSAEANQPFLLVMAWAQTHTALHGTKFKGKSKHGRYGDEVMELDWSVGEIMSHLKKLGLADNTLVYFTSDHGGHLEETGPTDECEGGCNLPYKGGKFQGGMEGGLRVPTVAMWPGHIPAGSVVDVATSQMDIFTTISQITQSKLPNYRIIDGKNILPLLEQKEKSSPHTFLFHYCNQDIHSVTYSPNDGTKNAWKLHFAQPNWQPGSYQCDFMCECNDAKFLDPPHLYNLLYDPSESSPCTPANEPCRGGKVGDYEKIRKLVKAAITEHKNSVAPVQDQFSHLQLLPRPWLQPCCNFPYCHCKEVRK